MLSDQAQCWWQENCCCCCCHGAACRSFKMCCSKKGPHLAELLCQVMCAQRTRVPGKLEQGGVERTMRLFGMRGYGVALKTTPKVPSCWEAPVWHSTHAYMMRVSWWHLHPDDCVTKELHASTHTCAWVTKVYICCTRGACDFTFSLLIVIPYGKGFPGDSMMTLCDSSPCNARASPPEGGIWVFLERMRILSEIKFTTHFIEILVVETKRFVDSFVNVISTRQTYGQRLSRAAASNRRALGNYFPERICYMFLISKCRGDWDLGLCTTLVLAFGVPQRNEFDGVPQRNVIANENPRWFEKYPTPP